MLAKIFIKLRPKNDFYSGIFMLEPKNLAKFSDFGGSTLFFLLKSFFHSSPTKKKKLFSSISHRSSVLSIFRSHLPSVLNHLPLYLTLLTSLTPSRFLNTDISLCFTLLVSSSSCSSTGMLQKVRRIRRI